MKPRIVFFLVTLLAACLFANWSEERCAVAVSNEVNSRRPIATPASFGMSNAGMAAMTELFRGGILSSPAVSSSSDSGSTSALPSLR